MQQIESLSGYNSQLSMLKITKKIYEEITGDRSTMASGQEQDTSELERLYKILERKKQIILYGPPGTGKTFSANRLKDYILSKNPPSTDNQTWLAVAANVLLENNGAAIDYHDFRKLAGQIKHTDAQTPEETIARDIRRDIKNNDSIFTNPSEGMYGLNLPTTFAKAAELVLFANNKPMTTRQITEIIIEKNLVLTNGETPERTLSTEFLRDESKGENSIFIQIDSATYALRKQMNGMKSDTNVFSRNVTFHQSYSYEDFVEGIRPIVTEDNKVIYKPVDGIFKEISNDARSDPSNKYVLLIDEINRGKTEKIFGELITLIEDDKRVESQKTTLPYTQEQFWIPKNLLIIGTMNTADRSIAQIDTALRRRFAFEELMPESELVDTKINGISLKALLEELNNRIRAEGVSLRDKQIGHSYFMKVKTLSDLRITFAVEIVPLLQDYFYSDYKKNRGKYPQF